ncbi:MAG: ankyrin repeat domain-containing protein [Polyangiaceae bacterium]|nr:ankyrin repeat domain-containing protein [Polyangiaceae bacterium]
MKVAFHTRDAEIETIWCSVVNRAKGLFRLDNIPYLRARPTYGDVIVATPGRGGMLRYRRTHKLGGFSVDALEYRHKATFAPLVALLEKKCGVVCEGFSPPTIGSPGVVAIAIPRGVALPDVGKAVERRFPDVRPVPSPEDEANERLHGAVIKGDLRTLRKALTEGARVNSKNEHGQSAVFVATDRGDAAMLKALRAAGANLRVRNELGQTGLHFAAAEGQRLIAKIFLDAGIGPNDRRNHYRASPLHLAALRDQADVAKLLLHAGARVDLRDDRNFTPLMCAADSSSTRTARALLPHCSAEEKNDAVSVAARRRRPAMVKLLLEAGASRRSRRKTASTRAKAPRKRRRAPAA